MKSAHEKAPVIGVAGALANSHSSSNIIPIPEAAQAIFTVFRHIRDTQPAATITLAQLADRARNPRIGTKASAPVIAPHNGSGKRKDHADAAMFSAVVVDHDGGDTSRDDIANYYGGTAHIAFTTSSHQQDGKGERWKVALPLAEALGADAYRVIAQGAAEVMGGDKAQARVQQIFVAPNKLTDDAPHECLIDLESPCLAPDDALGEQFVDAGRAIEAKQDSKARSAPVRGGGGTSPRFKRANGRIDIADALERNGYRTAGTRWMAPDSTSGTPGVVLFTDGDKPRVFSHHGIEDPLSALNHDNHALDAVDVVSVLEHKDDIGAALDALKPDPGQLLDAAKALTTDSDVDAIQALIEEASDLPALRRKAVRKAIKAATGFTFEDMDAAVAEARDEADDAPDHRDLALSLINRYGAANLIADDGHLWRYNAGVWAPLTEPAIRHAVQESLVEDGNEVRKAIKDGTADALKSEQYRPGHVWDAGADEAVSVANGLLVLTDGEWRLVGHRREDYRTSKLPIEYNAKAGAPRFEQFLCEIFEGDPDAIDKMTALLEMIGYTLMSHTRYEKYMILNGESGSGKSRVLNVVSALCGAGQVAGVQPSQMDSEYHRAYLHRKLANIVSELPEGGVLPDAQIKSIVSGETSTVRPPYGHPFDLRPYVTVWFATNHMPACRDYSGAVQARTMVIECNRVFRGTGRDDPDLDAKLAAEAPGILNMALKAYAGVVARRRFTDPKSSVAAKAQWLLDTDQVARFIDECCTQGEGEVQTTLLFDQYQDWARNSGISRLLSQQALIRRVKARGFDGGKSSGTRVLFGLSSVGSARAYFKASRGQ